MRIVPVPVRTRDEHMLDPDSVHCFDWRGPLHACDPAPAELAAQYGAVGLVLYRFNTKPQGEDL